MKRFSSDRRGVTLVEALVAIAIMGLIFGLTKLGVDWMVSLGRQRVLMNAQWNAQVTLYEITRNIRNCKQIVSVSTDTLELAVFRPTEAGGFNNPNFVVTAETATLRYQFVTKGNETYLLRTIITPTAARENKQLVNMLERPTEANFIFKPYGVDTPGRYEAVEVMIRLRPSYWSASQYDKPIEYRTISMKRTSTG